MMTIYSYHLPFTKPFKTGMGDFKERSGFIIHYSDNRYESLVEASPLPGFSRETYTETLEVLHQQKNTIDRFMGSDFSESELRNFLKAFPKNASLQFALSYMGIDLLVQRRKITIKRLFGKSPTHLISVNKVIGLGTGTDLLESVKIGYQEGFTTFKIKVDSLSSDTLSLLEQLTKNYPNIKFRLDANRSWKSTSLDTFTSKLRNLPIEYIEEPITFAELHKLVEYIKKSPIPIALDETLVNLNDLNSALQLLPDTVLVIKPMLMGNFFDLYETITRFRSLVNDVVVTTALESGVGRSMVQTVASLLGDPAKAHGLDTAHLLKDDLHPGPFIKKGLLSPNIQERMTLRLADINKEFLKSIV